MTTANHNGRGIEGVRKSERGSVAIHIALMMIVIIGMAALSIEIGYVLLKHREMQSAADGAALSGAIALGMGSPADFRTEARAVAAAGGFSNGANGITVTVNSPPTTGPQAGSSGAVEVIVTQPQTLSLVSLFRSGVFNVGAHAVATIGGSSSCVLQLDGSASAAVTISNGAHIELDQCGMAIDSAASTALSLSGGARLSAPTVSVVGGASISNGARIDPSDALRTAQPPVSDPYAGVAVPSYSGCGGGNNRTYNWGNWTLTPGVYCNGLSFQNAANATMLPGVYVIDRGTFLVGGGSTLTGNGVTIVLTSSTHHNYSTIDIGNGSHVSLAAPTSGSTAGVVFFGDRGAPASNNNVFQGGVAVNIVGTVYFPTQKVTWNNGSSNTSQCTQLIAATMEFQGGARFQNNCPQGVRPIGGGRSKLVE